MLVDKTGKIRTYYDKVHMYDVVLSKREKYFESKTFSAGKKLNLLFYLGENLAYQFVMI